MNVYSQPDALFCNILMWEIRQVYPKPQVFHVGQVKNIFTLKTGRIQTEFKTLTLEIQI